MTVTGLAPCRNWAPAILMCLPRSAPIPCEWAPSPGSSALAYFDRAAVPVMTGLAARSSGACATNNDFPEVPDEWARRWPAQEIWFACRSSGSPSEKGAR